jgi:SAM-dependent methyltransferase
MKRDWYDRHAERYERLEPGLPGDVAWYVALARAVEPPVLELGCGTGRVTRAIMAAGRPVTGLDRSSAMLAVARRYAPDLPIDWVQGDMRAFDLGRTFGLVCIPFRGFMHLATDTDRRRALACIRAHLEPGGLLAFNVANLTPTMASLMDSAGRLRPSVTRQGAYPGRPVAYVSADEMRVTLDAAGFRVERLNAGFAGEPFYPDSGEQVWLCRRDG